MARYDRSGSVVHRGDLHQTRSGVGLRTLLGEALGKRAFERERAVPRARVGDASSFRTVRTLQHLLRHSFSDILCDERMDRFQTRVGVGSEKETKCPQKKTQLGDV